MNVEKILNRQNEQIAQLNEIKATYFSLLGELCSDNELEYPKKESLPNPEGFIGRILNLQDASQCILDDLRAANSKLNSLIFEQNNPTSSAGVKESLKNN